MISLRQLAIIALVVLGIWLFRRLRRLARRRPRERMLYQDTVRCGRCGTYIPRSRAVAEPRGWSCGDAACVARHSKHRSET